MKNSKRFARILSVMLCSILAATAISGCGKGGNESSTPASGSSTSTPASSGSSTKGSLYIEGSEGVTLTYWIPIDSTAAQHGDGHVFQITHIHNNVLLKISRFSSGKISVLSALPAD